jgi:hypothetical protein
MNIILKYNDDKYNYNLDTNLEIGYIFENIIDFYDLIINNVDNIVLYMNYYNKQIREYILGINNLLFHIKFKDFMEQNNFNYVDIIKIEIFDKKINIDNIFKENFILDKYYKWYQEKESNKYIKYLSTNLSKSIYNNIENLKNSENSENSENIFTNNIKINENKQEKEVVIKDNINNIYNNIFESNFRDLFSNNIIQDDMSNNNLICINTQENISNEKELENIDSENIDVLRSNLLNNMSILFSPPIINYIDILNEFHFTQDDNNMEDNIGDNLYENIITALTDDEFNNLEKINYNDNDNLDKNNCNICLTIFDNNEKIIKLKCSHYFHIKCIETWLKKHSNKCPMCRIEVAKGIPINF